MSWRMDRLRAILFRRPRYRITRGGFLFLFAVALTGAGAFLSGNNLLFLIFAAMLALLMVSGFISRLSLAGLELELLIPEHVSARAVTPARIRIRNLKRFTASFSIEVSGRGDPDGNTPPILTTPAYFPLIGGRQSVETTVQVVFSRRGRHRENLFLLSTKFPFGFIRRSAMVALRHETVVYPSLEPQPGMELLLENLTNAAEAQVRGGGNDYLQIRPYATGDDARHTHWKSTARTGMLQLREFGRDERRPVELWLDRQMEPGQEKEFEDLIGGCAFVTWQLARRGMDVIFRTDGVALSLTGGEGLYDILVVLALVEPCGSISGAPLEQPADQSGLQVVFSARRRRSE